MFIHITPYVYRRQTILILLIIQTLCWAYTLFLSALYENYISATTIKKQENSLFFKKIYYLCKRI